MLLTINTGAEEDMLQDLTKGDNIYINYKDICQKGPICTLCAKFLGFVVSDILNDDKKNEQFYEALCNTDKQTVVKMILEKLKEIYDAEEKGHSQCNIIKKLFTEETVARINKLA